MKEAYLVVAGRIRLEIQKLTSVAERIRVIWEQGQEAEEDYFVDAVALNLFGFYAGLELIFGVIADGIDRAKPTDPKGRGDLLPQMAAEIPGLRPPVISPELHGMLARYRGFHHVVGNVYTFGYDSEGVEALVKHLPGTVDLAVQELSAFADFLEGLVNNAEQSSRLV